MLPMALLSMAPLRAENVCYLVYHTLGPVIDGVPVDVDQSAEAINDYHRNGRGWSGIGYHFVIRKDGTVEPGRPITKQGAHAKGINWCSIGIAFSGHGDIAPLTPAQMEAGAELGARLVREYAIELHNVIGHREINKLVDRNLVEPQYRTGKSCPGVRVPMHRIRLAVANRLFPPPEPIAVSPPDLAA